MANIILATSSLICTVVVINFYFHSAFTQPSARLKTIIHKYIARALRMQSSVIYATESASNNKEKPPESGIPPSTQPPNFDANNVVGPTTACADDHTPPNADDVLRRSRSEWFAIGVVVDRFFFVVYLSTIVFVAFVMLCIYPLSYGGQWISGVEPIRLY